jgi:hypothetical protein
VISSNPIFATTPFFLFLNKKDLFEKMIKQQVRPLQPAVNIVRGPSSVIAHSALDCAVGPLGVLP